VRNFKIVDNQCFMSVILNL